jgi:hypothetical protein
MAFNKNKEPSAGRETSTSESIYQVSFSYSLPLEKSERVQVKALVCKSVRPAPVVCVQGFKAGRTA